MSNRSLLLAALATAALVIVGCSDDDDATEDAEPTTTEATGGAGTTDGGVEVVDFTFSPDTVTVPVGTSLTFTNSDDTTHTATALDGEFDTGDIAGGSDSTVTLDEAGEIDYRCEIHQSMTGTVVVADE